MRKIMLAVCISGLSAAVQPQVDPFAVLEASSKATITQPRLTMTMRGWSGADGKYTHYSQDIWLQGGLFWIISSVQGAPRLTIVGDGRRVWRYDHLAKEYSYIKQDPDPKKALATAVAWSRQEAQRPIRFLTGVVRWLGKPEGSVSPAQDRVDVWELTATGEGWRGSQMLFLLDVANGGRLTSFEISERYDQRDGSVWEAYTHVAASYPPEPFGFKFEFAPPLDAKPAADLPR